MKKLVILVLILFVFCVFLPSLLFADGNDDLQKVKKAVKKNPDFKPGQEVQWFKVLITDEKTGKDRVRVTIPVSVIEIIFECVDEEDFKFDDDCDVDVRELFRELKKLGPMALIEVYDEGEIVKVWFE